MLAALQKRHLYNALKTRSLVRMIKISAIFGSEAMEEEGDYFHHNVNASSIQPLFEALHMSSLYLFAMPWVKPLYI